VREIEGDKREGGRYSDFFLENREKTDSKQAAQIKKKRKRRGRTDLNEIRLSKSRWERRRRRKRSCCSSAIVVLSEYIGDDVDVE
jgi:hypothetical protein